MTECLGRIPVKCSQLHLPSFISVIFTEAAGKFLIPGSVFGSAVVDGSGGGAYRARVVEAAGAGPSTSGVQLVCVFPQLVLALANTAAAAMTVWRRRAL